jgi:iron complex outermembrane receptor protein
MSAYPSPRLCALPIAFLPLAAPSWAQDGAVALPQLEVQGAGIVRLTQDPVSATTLPRDTIEQAGIKGIEDVAPMVPNTLLTNQGSPRFSINTMRGIGNTIRNDYFASTVGMYVDGVAMPTAEFSRRLVDIDSIEVVRGPNGTSRGRQALAGSINIRTRQPDDTFTGSIEGTIGDWGQRGALATLGGAVIPGALYARGYFDYSRRDGFVRDSTGGDIDRQERFNGGFSLRYQRDPSLSITLSADAQEDRIGAYAFLPYNSYRSRSLSVTPPSEERLRAQGVSGTVEYDMGFARLSSITAYRRYTIASRQDLSYSPMAAMFGGGRTYSDEDGWQFSQEFRLSSPVDARRLRWTFGAYYQRDRVVYDYLFNMPAFGPPSRYYSRYDRDEIAGFGEATVQLPWGFEVTGGLRVARDVDKLDSNVPFNGTTEATLTTPRLQLAWRADADRMVYASLTQGARSGGFSRLSTAPGAYRPEYLTQYELGLRSNWFNRRLALNATLFRIDWDDQQITQLVGAGLSRTTNAGRSYSQGLELEAIGQILRGLEVSGRLGLTEARYDRYVDENGRDLSGRRLVNTPNMTAGASVQHRTPIGRSEVSLTTRLDWALVGSHYFDVANSLRQSAYSLVNLRATVDFRNYSLSVFANNLFDTRYRAYGFTDSFGHDVAIAGTRRLVGATLRARF